MEEDLEDLKTKCNKAFLAWLCIGEDTEPLIREACENWFFYCKGQIDTRLNRGRGAEERRRG